MAIETLIDDPLICKTLRSGDEIGALRIASRYPSLGKQRDAIQRGWEAHRRPELYRQMGKDRAALVAAGIAAVRERYAA